MTLNPQQFGELDPEAEAVFGALGGVPHKPHHSTMSNDDLDRHMAEDHMHDADHRWYAARHEGDSKQRMQKARRSMESSHSRYHDVLSMRRKRKLTLFHNDHEHQGGTR